MGPKDAGSLQICKACNDLKYCLLPKLPVETPKICSAVLHVAANDSKRCLKGNLPSPAGVEMVVAVGLTVVAAWTAIEGMQLHTAEVYIEEHLIS